VSGAFCPTDPGTTIRSSRASDFHQHTAENTRKDHNVEYTPPGTLERIANPHRMRDSSVEGTRDRQGRTVRDV
jgi:hypothetical protein